MGVGAAAYASRVESVSKQAAQSIRQPLTRALLTLTFTTGLIDGASYLGLGHVFTANMTGNVVLLGFGPAGGMGLPVIALLAFAMGVRNATVRSFAAPRRRPTGVSPLRRRC